MAELGGEKRGSGLPCGAGPGERRAQATLLGCSYQNRFWYKTVAAPPLSSHQGPDTHTRGAQLPSKHTSPLPPMPRGAASAINHRQEEPPPTSSRALATGGAQSSLYPGLMPQEPGRSVPRPPGAASPSWRSTRRTCLSQQDSQGLPGGRAGEWRSCASQWYQSLPAPVPAMPRGGQPGQASVGEGRGGGCSDWELGVTPVSWPRRSS